MEENNRNYILKVDSSSQLNEVNQMYVMFVQMNEIRLMWSSKSRKPKKFDICGKNIFNWYLFFCEVRSGIMLYLVPRSCYTVI